MKSSTPAGADALLTGITLASVHLVTRTSNSIVAQAKDGDLRGPVFLDCLVRSHLDYYGFARIKQDQLAAEAGVSDRTIREWTKVCEERFGWKVARFRWSGDDGRPVNEYWLPVLTTGWSLMPTAVLRAPGVPYQSKLLMCCMARVSEGPRGSRMPQTLAEQMGYKKAKDVWKWLQPVQSLIELWREGDSKKLFWCLPGGHDMTVERVMNLAGEEGTVTWSGLQDQAPLLPKPPSDTGTATSGIEDPLDKPKTLEDAPCGASQDQQLGEGQDMIEAIDDELWLTLEEPSEDEPGEPEETGDLELYDPAWLELHDLVVPDTLGGLMEELNRDALDRLQMLQQKNPETWKNARVAGGFIMGMGGPKVSTAHAVVAGEKKAMSLAERCLGNVRV